MHLSISRIGFPETGHFSISRKKHDVGEMRGLCGLNYVNKNYRKRRSFHFSIRVYPFSQNLYGFQNYLESLLPNFLHLKSAHQNSHQPKSIFQIQILKISETISEDIPLGAATKIILRRVSF